MYWVSNMDYITPGNWGRRLRPIMQYKPSTNGRRAPMSFPVGCLCLERP